MTGGPGAGKTAVLELVRQSFCPHVKVLPEAAGILFAGGFPRRGDGETRRASQRAIFYVQRELELAADAENLAIVLCDRGTVDGSAYWPGPDDFSTSDSLDKAGRVLEILRGELPDCCRRHERAEPRPRDWGTAREGTTASS